MDQHLSMAIDASLFNTGLVTIFRWSATPSNENPWPVLFASGNTRELLGFQAKEFLSGKIRYSDLIHPDDLHRVADEVMLAVQAGTSHFQHQDYRIFRKNGECRWVMDFTMIQRDKSGQAESFIGYLIDVTERKQSETQLLESEQRYRELFQGSRVVEFLLDPIAGVIVDVNKAACEYYGYSAHELKGMPITQINILSEQEIRIAMQEAERDKRSHFIFKHRLASGEIRDVEVHTGPLLHQGRELLYSIVHDITDRLEAERKLVKLSSALDQSGSIVMLTDANHHIEYVNQRFTRVTGFSLEEVVGQHVDYLSAGRTSSEVRQHLSNTLKQGQNWHGELLCRRKNGELYWSSMSISPVVDRQGQVSSVVAVAEDLTEQRETDRKIQQLAFFDPTTGLGNRPFLLESLDEFFAGQAGAESAEQDTVALIFIDLDDFKRINDSMGHEVGDRLIKTVAHRLKVIVSDDDVLVRVGGDEFAILKTVTTSSAFEHWLDQLVYQFSRTVKLGPHTVNVFASMGIAMLPHDAEDTSTALRNAELAMYRSKRRQGSGYHFFSEEMNHQAVQRLQQEVQLSRALNQQEFELHYQPKIRLADGVMVGVEALIRWNDPVRGMIPPNDFIPLAEETGLIMPLSQWIMTEACQQVVRWQKAGLPPLTMAINLSARQFQDPLFIENIANILRKTGVNPACIELEITESMLMENMDDVLPMLHQLKGLGVSLAIDDFGTGYSSLAYLKQMPIDVLKVDRAFVKDIGAGKKDRAITCAIILLAQQLELKVVAEGIETQEQAEFLTSSGCNLGQGFLYSRPLQVAALEKALRNTQLTSA
ncbi:PAS domain S-box-containing protein/diguanylate cyclase (GGDEF) domain-containing protein [Oceanospirillum multiglobuliferum]|uniref:cyclic-guanylate-specific phosphodiesterase n=1 Tax=Oceanospirillum multiglobuliferum TaxID=64969 RepID=A0A1T4SML4_9GAMM|nr:EAL domain-containing protein [Oceanospirillum multiglobuliferum]OPX54168.1 hypothetical protein BTE48_15525 [Oceanospirillum multiglobuliferum]SKA29452.1 PAS domain S-box-containing protein/diguanylate cyclase (GGDEF) domain-containing protein [Oceanospirillum multiglobuliferum]